MEYRQYRTNSSAASCANAGVNVNIAASMITMIESDLDNECEQGNWGTNAKLGRNPQASNINEALREKSSDWEAKLNAGQFL